MTVKDFRSLFGVGKKEGRIMKDTWGREVTVDTEIWRSDTGNGWTGKEPRGRGTWAFHFGGYSYGTHPSTDLIILDDNYSSARKEAMRQCAAAGHCTLVVLAPAKTREGYRLGG